MADPEKSLSEKQSAALREALNRSRRKLSSEATAAFCETVELRVSFARRMQEAHPRRAAPKKQRIDKALRKILHHVEAAIEALASPDLRWSDLDVVSARNRLEQQRSAIGVALDRPPQVDWPPPRYLAIRVLEALERYGIPTGGDAAAEVLAVAHEALTGTQPADLKRYLMHARNWLTSARKEIRVTAGGVQSGGL